MINNNLIAVASFTPTSLQSPNAWVGHLPFAAWVIKEVSPKIFVELGTHSGNSYFSFCQSVIEAGISSKCYAVDTWHGDEHAGQYSDDVFAKVNTYHQEHFAEFSRLLRTTFDDAATYFSDESIDLLHIDGLHTYEAVRHDFETWLPKLAPGAIVIFHDTNVRERNFGVWKIWEELQAIYPNSLEFVHSHGLGVLQLNNAPENKVQRWLQSDSSEKKLLVKYFAALGSRQLERYDLNEIKSLVSILNQTVAQREGQLENIRQAAPERDEQLFNLKNAVADRDEQLSNLKNAVADRDGQLASLTKSLAERNDQLAARRIAVSERDIQINSYKNSYDNLARRHHDLDFQLQSTLNTRSWRITYPLRVASTFIQTVLPNLRTIFAPSQQVTRNDVSSIDPEPTLDAAEMAIARTGRKPSTKYLSTVEPVDLTLASLRQRNTLPKYSVIILQYNQSQLTINCINSILRNTSLEDLEIVVVDNGSNREHVVALDPYKHFIKILEIGVNRYYGEGNNLGVEFARGEFVILMNNDIAVTEGWLETISEELKLDVGAVGPCFIYPDDIVQEAGGYIAADGIAEQRFKLQQTTILPADSYECDYVSGALLLIRKSDFIAVNGFDLCWEPAYYEDVDLCLKLRLLGLKTICCPAVRIYHVENATSSNKSLNLGLENIVEVNKVKFIGRWGSFLSCAATEPTASVMKVEILPVVTERGCTPEYNQNKPRALIYTPYPMTPGGGERYILSIAAALAVKYEVTIAFTHPYSSIRLKQQGEYFGLELSKLKSSTIGDALSEEKKWDLTFILGNSLCPPFSALSEKSFYICQFPFDHKLLQNTHLPLSAEYTYICYSEFVSSFVARALHNEPVKGIHVLSPPVKLFFGLDQKSKKIISIGRFFVGGHCKNQHILIDVFKTLLTEEPALFSGWELVLAGSTMPDPSHRKYFSECQAKAQGYPIRILPDVSSEVMARELSDASIYWHGAGLGVDGDDAPENAEHFGITPLEAASAGCLVVVHNSGGTGELSEQFPECIFSYSTIESLHQVTSQLIQRSPENVSSLREATKVVSQRYSYENFETNLFKLISLKVS